MAISALDLKTIADWCATCKNDKKSIVECLSCIFAVVAGIETKKPQSWIKED